ncbi:hypothetical protein [Volucribacter amazonae]|uniref:Uncharacterized protein n=1 Tax=Volucribacter amazonae TaxID=256731 RepID=A0A9X4SJ68_9PAST|nr:hypothetical protein [Volucribacter amazonae]MDG6896382.1 hypothetical protein [Volucribacter amazonae]MDG6896424.1 hypothetical protein [Volucribacter amazonae]
MKFKRLLIPALLAFGLSACNDKEATNYNGTYASDSGVILILEKIKSSEDYKFTTEIYKGKKFSVSAQIKNQNQLYDSKGNLLGEFEGNNFKNTKGVIFSKSN